VPGAAPAVGRAAAGARRGIGAVVTLERSRRLARGLPPLLALGGLLALELEPLEPLGLALGGLPTLLLDALLLGALLGEALGLARLDACDGVVVLGDLRVQRGERRGVPWLVGVGVGGEVLGPEIGRASCRERVS
jgi:hypothetical protein